MIPVAIDPMRVCRGCGVIAPLQRSTCSVCNADFASGVLTIPPRPDGAYWVCFRARFQCRACGHKVPLNHMDDDGSVECARCGLDQAFEVDMWKDMLELAHAVGDLAGPNPEGRHRSPVSIAAVNPRRSIGLEHTTCSKENSIAHFGAGGISGSTLSIELSPGFCLCPRCKVPLDAMPAGGGGTKTRCPQCTEEAEYSFPARAGAMLSALKAVVADGHRVGHAEAKLTAPPGGGAILLSCPNCNAALPDPGGGGAVTCPYCKAVALIPTKARFGMAGKAPEPVPWWALFIGPSKMRRELEAKVTGIVVRGPGEEADDDEDEAPRAQTSALGAQIAASVERTQRTIRLWVTMVIVGSFVLTGVLTAIALVPAGSCNAGEDAPASPQHATPAKAPAQVPVKAPGKH